MTDKATSPDLSSPQPAPAEEPKGLIFPFSAPGSAAELVEIRPGIGWLRLPMPYALDHVNVYLLRTPRGWLIVDTGLDSPDTRSHWEAFLSGPFRDETFCGILCTHYHVDHAGLAGFLSELLKVPVFMSYQEYFTLRGWPIDVKEVNWQHALFFKRAGLPEELLPGTLINFDFSQEISNPPLAFSTLRDGRRFAPGGGDWRVMTGEGHSPEHSMLYSAAEGILFSGDQLLPRITSNVSVSSVNQDDEPLSGWFASLDRLDQLPDRVLVLPGHGLPFLGVRQRVAELRVHHEQKFQTILDACAEERLTAYQLVSILYPRPLGDFDLQLALGECLAHLHYLLDHGRIAAEALEGGAMGYSSVPAIRQAPRHLPLAESEVR